MLDLRFSNVENKNKNSKYEKGDKYVKFQRLYKRYEKEIEGKYKKDIPQFKKLKKANENYKLYKKNVNEGRRGFIGRIFSKNDLSEQSKRELFILTKKMDHLDLYFELKRDLSELFAHVTETLNTKSFANGESRDYSSRIDKMIEKLNKFRTIQLEEKAPANISGTTSGGKKKKVVRKRVTKKIVKK
jgi:hypothetical protein